MNGYPPSLLSRLRARLGATAWLFALLVMAKATLATACFDDGMPVPAPANTGALTFPVASEISAHTDAVVSATLESGSGESCWHDGPGGCHCACAHAAPMAGSCGRFAAIPLAGAEFASAPAFPLLARREPALRPPIA
ncbi:MAG TPA: hypothetical protein VGC55_03210 [Dokdonella sp.]